VKGQAGLVAGVAFVPVFLFLFGEALVTCFGFVFEACFAFE